MCSKVMTKHVSNQEIEKYRKSLVEQSLPETYKFLLEYMNQLQREFSASFIHSFVTKKVLNGYLDYTYFYFSNDLLKEKQLKLGIIFNHQKISFDLWLMGTTKESQRNYWKVFKDTEWNTEDNMPTWYIVSVDLVTHPDFENLERLSKTIIKQVPTIYSQLVKVISPDDSE